MLRHIPGLQSLKAFDASARHLNFTRAAAELNVTPAAVSHQIKELEEAVGVPLFQRTSRHMQLTRQGQILKPAIADALEGLTRALQKLRQVENPTQVRVTVSPSLAAKWLVPRLDRFLESVPGADVRIDVSSEPLDFDREDIDVAIRFGDGNYPGLVVEKLFHDTLFPVCSPGAAEGRQATEGAEGPAAVHPHPPRLGGPGCGVAQLAHVDAGGGGEGLQRHARPALQPDLARPAGGNRRPRRGAGRIRRWWATTSPQGGW